MTVATVTPSELSIESVLKRTQAIAGALFSIFVLLHLSNIILAPFGIEAFNNYQQAIRPIYQHPIIEILFVFVPLTAHAIAGVWLWFIRPARTHRRPWRARFHTWAGLFLLIFITGHILAVRGSSFFFDVYPEFEGLSFSLWYIPAYFYPYYFLLAVAGFFHATNGLKQLAARKGVKISNKLHGAVIGIFSMWMVVTLLSLGGVMVEVSDPTNNDFARLAAELTGTNLNP